MFAERYAHHNAIKVERTQPAQAGFVIQAQRLQPPATVPRPVRPICSNGIIAPLQEEMVLQGALKRNASAWQNVS